MHKNTSVKSKELQVLLDQTTLSINNLNSQNRGNKPNESAVFFSENKVAGVAYLAIFVGVEKRAIKRR